MIPSWLMTDSMLDNAYDEARVSGDLALAAEYQSVIIDRIGVLDFVQSVVMGTTDFPLYEKWTQFGAQQARESVAVHAEKVAQQAKKLLTETSKQMAETTSDVVIGIIKGAWPLLLVGGGAYMLLRGRNGSRSNK